MTIQLLDFQFIDCCIPLKYKDFVMQDLETHAEELYRSITLVQAFQRMECNAT